jgi:hypothetical protein
MRLWFEMLYSSTQHACSYGWILQKPAKKPFITSGVLDCHTRPCQAR